MSTYFYEKELNGERETARQIVNKIEEDFQRYNKDAPKNGLKYAQNMLNTFYQIYRASKANANYDVFVDIYVRVISPHLNPDASPTHFKNLLPHLEHLFLTIANFELHPECDTLYKCIAENQLKWPDTDGFKCLLSVHGTEIMRHLRRTQTKQSIDGCLANLKELFQYTSSHSQQSELNVFDLFNLFIKTFKIHKSQVRTLLSTNLSKSQKEGLFGTYFDLLNNISSKALPATVSVEDAFISQLNLLYYFINMDVADNLECQIALKHTKILCGMGLMKQNQYIDYCAQFIHNLIKLCYVRLIAHNFKEHYQRLCEQFCKMIDKRFYKESWFQEILFVVYQLQMSMRPSSNEGFYIFWAQIDAELFATHLKFVCTLVKALSYNKNSKLLQYDCCKSNMFSQHNQVSLATTSVENYEFMIKKLDNCNKESLESINKLFREIINCALNALLDMDNNCKSVQSQIHKFSMTTTNLMTAAKNPDQAFVLIEIAEILMKSLKSRLLAYDRQMLLRRVYQLGTKTKIAAVAAELHCYYIAELMSSKNSSNTVQQTLHNQLYFFYNGIAVEFIKQGNCLLKIYMQKNDDKTTKDSPRTVFKPLLQKHQKRWLHWLEAQYIFSFCDSTNAELYENFVKCSQSNYDFLLTVSAANVIDRHSIRNKVENIYELLCTKKNGGKSLERLEELELAHAASLLWKYRNEKQPKSFNQKDFIEDNLCQLMQDKALIHCNVRNESAMIQIALDSLFAFKAFFERADMEPIPDHEGGFLDWQSILKDVTSLAVYFQFSGYINYAIEAWLLHYKVAKTLEDIQSCVRSLTFFCEYHQYAETLLNIEEELEIMSHKFIHIFQNLPQLIRRHQNFSLIFLCQIAYFNAINGKIENSQSYLTFARKLHTELGRGNQYDIVLFTADIVEFRILWKCNTGNKCKQNSLLNKIDLLLKRVEDYSNISSVDNTLFNLLMISSVSDFAEFTANRLIENILNAFFACCLKLSVDAGAALLTVKTLSKWANINLKMEYLPKAEIKFLLIECILGLRDPDEVASSLKKFKNTEPVKVEDQPSLKSPNLEVVRKVAVYSNKSLKAKQTVSSMAFDLKLEKFLDTNEKGAMAKRTERLTDPRDNFILWARFTLGTLRARFNFLAKNFNELQNFYESCQKWLSKRRSSFYYKLFYSDILLNINEFSNFLRSTQKFDKVKNLIETYLDDIKNIGLSTYIDSACRLNLQEQLKDAILEQLERKNRILPKRQRLNLLMGAVTTTSMPKTPLNKTTRYAPLPMTVNPSNRNVYKTTTAFTIYSDRKPKRTTTEKRDLCYNSTVRKDLKFTETKQKLKDELNEVINLESDSEDEKEVLAKKSSVPEIIYRESIDLDKCVESMKIRTKESRTTRVRKLDRKLQKDQHTLVQDFEELTIEDNSATASKTKEQSPQSTASAASSDVFKTPSSSLASASVLKTKTVRKQKQKCVETSKTSSISSTDSNSSDTGSSNSYGEQKSSVSADKRRLRLRQVAIVDDAKPIPAASTSSRRRPR